MLPEAERANCIVVFRWEIPVRTMSSELKISDVNGNAGEVEFKVSSGGVRGKLIKIEKNPQPTAISLSQRGNNLDPRYKLNLRDVAGKTYFYRKTVYDQSYNAPGTVGTAGSLMKIKFEAQRGRLVIKRVDNIRIKKDSGPIDQEEVGSFPAKFYVRKNVDVKGSNVQSYEMREVEYNEAEIS